MKIQGRYGAFAELTDVGPNKLRLVLTEPQYARCGYDTKSGEMTFVDPSGGPFIGLGENPGIGNITLIEMLGDSYILTTTPTPEKK